ncbi:flagellar hook-basal body complex protein [Neptuniibacter halophilus]|uniref:flagellar hook-basal body complex protein n=1 Tax=Neptuniibacter halophilus TaxID=651666 RepID=UPI00257423DB|nr:flagellar hook-basal body complex protein [Neptuniibacter halophilus]
MAGFNTAVTGLKAASTDLDVIGNNIANSSTVGFKTSRTEFGDIYATAVVGAGSSNVAGSGVTVTDIAQDFQAGTIEFTNNNLDLAINGSGFFQLDDGQGGVTYSRAGAFELNKDGFIVSKSGKFLQGYGLDTEGNRLPIGNLAVTQKESPPKATEEIDLSFNIDSREDAATLLADYDKDEPGSFTYSTTVRTFDSLGNEHTIKFNFAEARPFQAQQQVTGITTGESISGVTITGPAATPGTHMAELTGYNVGDVIDSSSGSSFFSELTDAINGDPRIQSITIDDNTDPVGFTIRFKAEYPEPDLVAISSGLTALEVDEIAANETHTFAFDAATAFGGVDSLQENTVIEVGGITISLAAGMTQDAVGQAITAVEANILDANPDVESVIYDNASNEVVVTYKAEAGDVNPGILVDANVGGGATNPIWDGTQPTIKQGDNSFMGVYRMYAYLNGTEQLDIGKALDPGEIGTGTEPGPILINFNPSNGLLNGINGETFSASAVVPTITITGADPADSTTVIELDVTNTTQFASESIVKSSAQDGYTKGDLIGVSFSETGEMVASFSNGQNQDLGVVAIATFENQSGLQPAGDTEWISTLTSGDAIVNPPGTGLNGTLRSAALEQSNVDLSAELVALIEAQRNFQANSKTIETQNTVTQAILQI